MTWTSPTISLLPKVVIYFPRFTPAVRETLDCVVHRQRGCTAVARACSAEETARFASVWAKEQECPLLIVRADDGEDDDCVAAIQHLLDHAPIQPGVVLLIEPDPHRQREANRIARQLAGENADLQVIEYASSWRQSPPRIR